MPKQHGAGVVNYWFRSYNEDILSWIWTLFPSTCLENTILPEGQILFKTATFTFPAAMPPLQAIYPVWICSAMRWRVHRVNMNHSLSSLASAHPAIQGHGSRGRLCEQAVSRHCVLCWKQCEHENVEVWTHPTLLYWKPLSRFSIKTVISKD